MGKDGAGMARELKVFNGRDWDCRGGHLYVCAWSMTDCAYLASKAYRFVNGLEHRPDVERVSVNEVKVYWSKGCWGDEMEALVPKEKRERGVWWTPSGDGAKKKPIKRLL